MILAEQHHDLVRQLQHLHGHMLEKKWYGFGPALIGGTGISHAGEREFALLLHDFGGPWLQDRIGVVADKFAVIAWPVSFRRDRFVTGPGPDAGGINQGRDP